VAAFVLGDRSFAHSLFWSRTAVFFAHLPFRVIADRVVAQSGMATFQLWRGAAKRFRTCRKSTRKIRYHGDNRVRYRIEHSIWSRLQPVSHVPGYGP
jgi:hypothetical protein